MAVRFSRLRFFLLLALISVVLFLTRAWWLAGMAQALIDDERPDKADIAVVLAGDWWGGRILKAGELVRAGYVPLVLVSGPEGNYGFYESDLSIPFAVRHGFPADWFVALPNRSRSTKEEAAAVLPELRRRNVKSFLLVTSNYHTGRARRIYLAAERAAGGGPPFRTVASSDRYFQATSWWRTREGQKTTFLEWSKTVATVFGL